MRHAADVLGVSKRQAYRIKKKIREKGVEGAIHDYVATTLCKKTFHIRHKVVV